PDDRGGRAPPDPGEVLVGVRVLAHGHAHLALHRDPAPAVLLPAELTGPPGPALVTQAKAAELHEEVRRLRLRVTALTTPQLDAGRRTRIRSALERLSELGAQGRPVPDRGDRVLADQVVVLLTDCLPEYGATDQQTERALLIAQELRHDLA